MYIKKKKKKKEKKKCIYMHIYIYKTENVSKNKINDPPKMKIVYHKMQ